MAQQVITTHAQAFEVPEHHRTNTGQSHRKILMWTFLGSECMFFGSLIATFLIYHDNTPPGTPTRPEVLSSLGLVSLMAFVLLASSFTMVLALSAARRGDQKKMMMWLFVTAFCGLFFIASQGFEFYTFVNRDHLTPRTNLFGASFMILTGFHGAHVSAGIIWLVSAALMVRLDPGERRPVYATMLPGFLKFLSGAPSRLPGLRVEMRPRHKRFAAFTRAAAPPPPPASDAQVAAMQAYETQRLVEERVLNIEIAGLYWHFVDVVWVVIFTVVYLLK